MRRETLIQHVGPAPDHCREEWWFVVKDETRAVTLHVYTPRFHESVPADVRAMLKPAFLCDEAGYWGISLDVHRLAEGEGGRRCDFLPGPCVSDGTGTGAVAFWKEHGDGAKVEQSEAFWVALEAWLEGQETP